MHNIYLSKIFMKKFLLWIVALFVWFIGFSSAWEITIIWNISSSTLYPGTVFWWIRSPFSSAWPFNYDCSFSNFNWTISDSTKVKFQAFSSNLAWSNLITFSSSVFSDWLWFSWYSSTASLEPVYFAFTLWVNNSITWKTTRIIKRKRCWIINSKSKSKINRF